MSEDIAVGSFGVAAAVLLVGGSVLIRWQRNRQQFLLMQTALLQGLRQFPAGLPPWVATLRQGITTLALGLGLIVVGAIAYFLGSRVGPPTAQELAQLQSAPTAPTARPGPATPARSAPARPALPTAAPANRPRANPSPANHPTVRPAKTTRHNGNLPGSDPRENGPRTGNGGLPGQPPPRQTPSPAMERWHFAQAEQTVGLLAVGSGIVLTLLGLVHVGFSGVERRHTPDRPADPASAGV